MPHIAPLKAAIAATNATRRALPHLGAFFPGHSLVPAAASAGTATALILNGAGPRPGPAGAILAGEAIWRAPRFGRNHAPVALLAVPCADGRGDPLRLALAQAGDAAAGRMAMARLREGRIGGAPGLPDPGAAGLNLPRGEAALVLDPGLPALRSLAEATLAGARRDGAPVVVALAPDAPCGARPVLATAPGVRLLPGRLAPWTLLDIAATVHGLGTDATELLALAAELPLRTAPDAPWAGRAAADVFAALAAATRCADPFHGCPWPLDAALRQLAEWRRVEAGHRRIVACTGIEWFKAGALRAALGHQAGAPPAVMRGSTAIRLARRAGGAVGVWAATMPPALPARCAAAGVPLVQIEDGFIRSAGLGVQLAPAASLVLDGGGIHFDPSSVSDLERILAETSFDDALLARAAALRQAVIAAGITKYNLTGQVPPLGLPRDRHVVLVAGQVEDDAAMLRGGATIRGNLALLRAVRMAEPDAFILYKPHPDVESGMRRGAVPERAALRFADRVLRRTPIGPLYGQVSAVHSIASLAGFEALIRGTTVACWGRPFYAGWGLTEDHDPPPRRGRQLPLDALVAAALILYPRCRDPMTGLPCPPELLLERLACAPAAPRGLSRIPAPLGGLVARISRTLATWWAAR